jgi:preprotein translocase subunit SecD
MRRFLSSLMFVTALAVTPVVAQAADPVMQIGSVNIYAADITDWSSTEVGPDKTPYADIDFSERKGQEVTSMTAAQSGRSIKIILCGKTVAEPLIHEPIVGASALVPTPDPQADTACLDPAKQTTEPPLSQE